MVTIVAIFALMIGGLLTLGVMQVMNFLNPETEAVATADTVDFENATEVTRTTTPTPLALTETAPTEGQVVEVLLAVSETPVAINEGDEMSALTSTIVDGGYDFIVVDHGDATRITLHYGDAETAAVSSRMRLIAQSAEGTIDPGFAIYADGKGVDADTLLYELIEGRLASGSNDEISAAHQLRRSAFAASDAKTINVEGRQIYTVRPHDSLAYIALQFFGSTKSARQLLAANKDVLTSPADLRSGMQLIIPNA